MGNGSIFGQNDQLSHVSGDKFTLWQALLRSKIFVKISLENISPWIEASIFPAKNVKNSWAALPSGLLQERIILSWLLPIHLFQITAG